MRAVRHHATNHVADFGELIHQVHAVVQAAGGVDKNDIGPLGNGAFNGVEGDGGRVRARGLLHNLRTGTLRPHGELLHGRSAEGIRRSNHHLFPLPFQQGRELADGGGFPHPIDPHDQHHVGLLAKVEGLHRTFVRTDQVRYLVPDNGGKLLHVHVLVLLHPLLYVVDELEGGIYPHIRTEQSLLQGIQDGIVHLGLTHDGPPQLLEEVQVGFFESFVKYSHRMQIYTFYGQKAILFPPLPR